MELPAVIRNRLADLERRFPGPIPRHVKFQASLPTATGRQNIEDINDCVEYYRWITSDRWRKLKSAARWAIASKDQSGLSASIDRERFRVSAVRLQEARYARAAWISARSRIFGTAPAAADQN